MAQGDAGLTSFIAAPKALLHDHLDGGLRPSTVIELADEIGWRLPSDDATELQAWFTGQSPSNGSKMLKGLAYMWANPSATAPPG